MNLDELQIDHRLNAIEHQLHFFKDAYVKLHNIILKGTNVKIEDESFKLIYQDVAKIITRLEDVCSQLSNESALGTLAFMGKKINEICQNIEDIKKDGVKKKIHLDLTMDGYEMVQKKKEEEGGVEINCIQNLTDLLHTLTMPEQMVLIHRFGLFGETPKTLDKTGEILVKSRERISQIQAKGLRKCRHPSRKKYIDRLTHKELKEAIIGK